MDSIVTLPIGEQVRAWRVGQDMSGAALAEALGISRGKVSELESGAFLPGVKVALAIEALSNGRIDACALNEDVRAARHGVVITSAMPAPSAGKIDGVSRA
jgi:transcriptional regulator with XRE-family HTH domain